RGVRIEQRVAIAEADDEADGDAAARHRVEEAAAEFFLPQRIAHRVDDSARLQPIPGNLPDFLQPDRVLGRVARVLQLQLTNQLLRQVAADAVAEARDLGDDVGAWL